MSRPMKNKKGELTAYALDCGRVEVSKNRHSRIDKMSSGGYRVQTEGYVYIQDMLFVRLENARRVMRRLDKIFEIMNKDAKGRLSDD